MSTGVTQIAKKQCLSLFETFPGVVAYWFSLIMQHCCRLSISSVICFTRQFHCIHTTIRRKKAKGIMKRAIPGLAIGALLCTAFFPAIAHEAHVHGVGKLDVAIDGSQVILHLDTPLMNLLGFEHAAKSTKDRQAAQQMVRQLRDAGKIFVTTPAAECRPASVKLVSAALDPILLGEAAAPAATDKPAEPGHADLDADFVFQCAHPDRLQSIDVTLFAQFKGFQKIDVQMVTPKKQLAATLLPSAFRLSW